EEYHDLEIRATNSSFPISFTPKFENLMSKSYIAETNLVLERIISLNETYPGFSIDDPGFRVVGFSGIGPEAQEIVDRYWGNYNHQLQPSLEDAVLDYDECVVDDDLFYGVNLEAINIQSGSPLPETIRLNLTSIPTIAYIIRAQTVAEDLWEAFFNIELLWDSWNTDIRPITAARIKLKDWTQVFQIKEELENQLGANYSINVLKRVGQEQIAAIHSYEDALRAVVLIGAAVEFLFVFSQMVVIVFSERRNEIGQLKVLGATRFDILKMMLFESLIYGIVGSFIGIYVGLIGAAVLSKLAGNYLVSAEVSIIVDFGSIAIGLLYGILITLLAGVLPAVYVAYQPPQLALQGYARAAYQLRTKHSLFFAGASIILFFLGLTLLAQVKATNLLDMTLFMDNAALIGIILLSAILLEIVLIRFLIPVFEKIWWPFPAFVRAISARSILRAYRRNCAAMITAAVGISFVISTAVFAASLEKTIPEFLQESSIAEIIMDSGAGNEQQLNLTDEIRAPPRSVLDVGYALGGQLYLEGVLSNAVGISANLLHNSETLHPPRITRGPANAFQLIATESHLEIPYCILSTSLAIELGLSTGDIINVALTPNGSLDALYVIALVEPTIFLNNGKNLLLDYSWLAEYFGLIGWARWFFVTAESPNDTYRSLKQNFSRTFHRIIPVYRQQERIKETLDQQVILFQTLLALVMISSLLTQGTAYLMAAIEREREVGIIRASGAKKSQVLQVFVVESMMMMITSLVVGLANAALLCGLLFHLASATGIKIIIVLPWDQILIWICLAIIFSYLASMIAFHRIRALNPAQALRIANQ
ncbi:MAG: ABC transporter permease, partial [Candidatus Hodarchaeota archaeon]